LNATVNLLNTESAKLN